MKYFPIILHLILTGAATGLAVGLDRTPDATEVARCTSAGLAAALGITGLIRILVGAW